MKNMSAVYRIEAPHARNFAVKHSRMASGPKVGILAHRRQSGGRLDFYNGKNDHATFWATLQRLLPQWKGAEYTDYPRGRVLYDSMEDVFLVYSSRGIVNSPGVRKMVLREFNLSLAATRFEADHHYENLIPPMLDVDFDA